jgi:hypothetical protein
MWTIWLAAGLALAADDERDSERDRARRALSPRHLQQSCGALVEGLEAPVSTLRWVAESVPQPPWVAVRAAGCLAAERPVEAREDLLRWVRSPEWAGLARATVAQVDRMPLELAQELATVAMDGPLSSALRRTLLSSENIDIQAIVANAEPAAPAVRKN